MKTFTPAARFSAALLFLASISLFAPGDAAACGCSSGCGMITDGLSADVKQLMEKAKSQGRSPISCIRTQACQDRLRACYERCGQFGRAARKSAHSDGKACDYQPQHRGPLRNLKTQMGLRSIQDLTHNPGHGGGLHVYTTRFHRINEVTPPKEERPVNRPPAKPEKPVAKPQRPVRPPPAERLPAGEGAGAYPTFANGKYKCPRGMQSICGSTRDTRWCQQWVRSGHTPGCHQ